MALIHTHITLTKFPKITPKGYKQTTINLAHNGRFQTDLMLTRHFKLESDYIQTVLTHISLLPIHTDDIIRIKIEQTSDLPDIIPDDNYLEIHAEIPRQCDIPTGWRYSYNPKYNDRDFINRRYYSGSIKDRIPHNMKAHTELVIYDSNHNHDSWWA